MKNKKNKIGLTKYTRLGRFSYCSKFVRTAADLILTTGGEVLAFCARMCRILHIGRKWVLP